MDKDDLPKLLLSAQEEIKVLKASILSWKDGWFIMREACAKNYWDGLKNGMKIKGIDPVLLARWKKLPPHNID